MHLGQVAGSVLTAGDSKAVLGVAQTWVRGTDSGGRDRFPPQAKPGPGEKGYKKTEFPGKLKLSGRGKTQRVCAGPWGGVPLSSL